MSIYFADKNWVELQKMIKKKALVILPVGTIEEHGMHLPVNTDVVIAEEVARRIGEEMRKRIPLLVMPAVWSGYSAKEMSRWPGTIRVRARVVMDTIFDICSSLIDMGFKKIVIINAHGHHTELLRLAAREIADKYGVYIAVTDPAVMAKDEMQKIRISKRGGAIHGGEYETSLMLYLNQPVDMKKATGQDIMRYHSRFYAGDNFAAPNRVFWSTWGIQKSKTGIYGDPTVATSQTGKRLMEAILKNYIAFIREFYRKTRI